MEVLIKQPAGLGDVFFCQKIGCMLFIAGYDVYWPLIPQFDYLPSYLDTDINFVFDNNYPGQVLDLEKSTTVWNDIFAAKYRKASEFLGMKITWDDWASFVDIKRNHEREGNLFDSFEINEPYIFVNENYGSPPNSEKRPISIDTDLRIIKMDYLGTDNIFDWIKILENAEEIHTVQTSLQFVCEIMGLKQPKYIYQRPQMANYSYLENVFKEKYIYD